ncbi:uncharacterized protein TRIVIDRAFT_224981 [Trichoderma virens Gv29-8]|uniref:Peptidase metallopeptidase domain-containing protein n=1 Tax=Hypocrea virens (strain Gv29-8 / FGSC 10586) TaxID=413071 RepID=G9N1Z4_HYPVG|nr:uncharacterized protein TRIVIDRAFT_224981 [Trichoderma virens Gv29-8]EHK19111.1 hypothetical protein TRIVIDRAFT_224981 [Trichoderma virens Gv29-8]UKZ49438.1 hypothetical protein TrVGV298_003685 [Trichoderma virens]
MSIASERLVIMKGTSIPASLVACNAIDGDNGTAAMLHESGCSSSEEMTSVSTPPTDRGDTSTDDGNIDDDASKDATRRILQELIHVQIATAIYNCITQGHGCTDIRLGWDNEIARWSCWSEVTYVICHETFPTFLLSLVEEAMRKAISMWKGIGVSFKQVQRNDQATFAVLYSDRKRRAYASAFFPNEQSRKLFIYESGLLKASYLANILAHEIGHILGLRHEYTDAYPDTDDEEKNYPSVCFGSKNDQSVMVPKNPEQLQVHEKDLEELRSFYSYDREEYKGLPIREIDPTLHACRFSNDSRASDATSKLSRRSSF